MTCSRESSWWEADGIRVSDLKGGDLAAKLPDFFVEAVCTPLIAVSRPHLHSKVSFVNRLLLFEKNHRGVVGENQVKKYLFSA